MTERQIFQVAPSDERNPFRATVIPRFAGDDFEDGHIRIVPPVDVGQALLDEVSANGDHYLNFWAGSKSKGVAATVIAFALKENPYDPAVSSRERITNTTQALLSELGYLVNPNATRSCHGSQADRPPN